MSDDKQQQRRKVAVEEAYSTELAKLNEIVQHDADKRTGSYNERNPMLGKMRACPFCGTRRYENGTRNGLPCCNGNITKPVKKTFETPALVASNKWQWSEERGQFEHPETEPRDYPLSSVAHKRKHPRLSRNLPPLFEMHQILIDWERDTDLTDAKLVQAAIEGLPGFHRVQKPVQVQGLATLAERYVTRKRKAAAKRVRDQQKKSRRINRG